MKINQLLEAKYATGDMTNEKIIDAFMVEDKEMADDAHPQRFFYTHENLHINDNDWDGGDIMSVVVYPDKVIAIDHDNNREWQTNPQQWTVSELRVIFKGPGLPGAHGA